MTDISGSSNAYAVVVGQQATELRKLRAVAWAGYWRLAMDWQSHLFTAPSQIWPPDMSIFAPESFAMMNSADQELFIALEALK